MTDLSELYVKINELLRDKSLVIVAIEGMSGAGKSSIVERLAAFYECNVFHMDNFFLPDHKRKPARYAQTGGNIDYERFKDEVINGIQSRQNFEYGVFSCSSMAIESSVAVNAKKLNIIEGAYSTHPYFGKFADLKVFMKIGRDLQMKRICARNTPSEAERFEELWIPMENKYFEDMEISKNCDIMFENFMLF